MQESTHKNVYCKHGSAGRPVNSDADSSSLLRVYLATQRWKSRANFPICLLCIRDVSRLIFTLANYHLFRIRAREGPVLRSSKSLVVGQDEWSGRDRNTSRKRIRIRFTYASWNFVQVFCYEANRDQRKRYFSNRNSGLTLTWEILSNLKYRHLDIYETSGVI